MTAQDAVPYPTVRTCPFSPPAEFADYREHEPMRRMHYPDGQVGWLVTSRSLARKVLSDSRFSARSDLKRVPVLRPGADPFFGAPALPGWILDLDAPDHTRIRQQLTGKFTARRMQGMRPYVEQVVAGLLDDMERDGGPVDLIEAFTLPLSTQTICELLGVPYSERDAFQRDSKILFSLGSTAEQASEAMDRLYVLVRSLVRTSGEHSGLLHQLAKDGVLDEDETVGAGVMMLTGGHGSTSSAMALGAYALLSHPEQLARLQADPALTNNAVDELLRYATIFHFGVPRAALEDFEFEGRPIKAGEPVTVALPAANRDPAWFTEDPDRLDIERRTSGHLAFGHGIHQCTGQSLVRVEMRAALSALFSRFPDLALAVSPQEIVLNTRTSPVYGVLQLPVRW
ncbi:cytochrome P450 [Streptomyces fuscichromogenes]|uniref:cytochrome P450 n=1 Tax=Streptomyces fuscichromogenes TaxID=1324013 RepID=UPI003824AE94